MLEVLYYHRPRNPGQNRVEAAGQVDVPFCNLCPDAQLPQTVDPESRS